MVHCSRCGTEASFFFQLHGTKEDADAFLDRFEDFLRQREEEELVQPAPDSQESPKVKAAYSLPSDKKETMKYIWKDLLPDEPLRAITPQEDSYEEVEEELDEEEEEIEVQIKADREKKRSQVYSMISTQNVIRHMDKSTEFWRAWIYHTVFLLFLVEVFIQEGGSYFITLTDMFLLPIAAMITAVVHLVWIRKEGSEKLWHILGTFGVLAVIQFLVFLAIVFVWGFMQELRFGEIEGTLISSHVDRAVTRLSFIWLILGVGAFLAASKLYKNVEAPLRGMMEEQLLRLQWEEELKQPKL